MEEEARTDLSGRVQCENNEVGCATGERGAAALSSHPEGGGNMCIPGNGGGGGKLRCVHIGTLAPHSRRRLSKWAGHERTVCKNIRPCYVS